MSKFHFYKLKLFSTLIGIVFLFSTVSTIYSLPIEDTYIIRFTDSQAETEAVEQLLEYNSNARVIIFDSTEMHFNLHRLSGKLFLVGHGSSDGMLTTSGMITWQKLAEVFNSVPADHVAYVACNSYEGSQLITSKPSSGLLGVVESKLGALLALTYSSLQLSENQDALLYSQLASNRKNELETLDSYNVLRLDEPGGPNYETVSYWQYQAENRIPYTPGQTNRDRIIDRGFAIAGSYADLYLDNQYYGWAALASSAAWIVAHVRFVLDYVIDYFAYASAAVLLAAAPLIAGLTPFGVFLITPLLIGITGALLMFSYIRYAAQFYFDMFTAVNEGIYNYNAWSHLAYNRFGMGVINALATNSAGFSYKYRNGFSYLYSNPSKALDDYVYDEQVYYAQNNHYINYNSFLINLLSPFVFQWIGNNLILGIFWVPSTHIMILDRPQASFYNPYHRTEWAQNVLEPSVTSKLRSSNYNSFVGGIRNDGRAHGGLY